MKQNNLDSNWFMQKLQCKNNLSAFSNCKNWKKSRNTSVSIVDKLKKKMKIELNGVINIISRNTQNI